MKLEILLSCMHQKDFSIVEKSCITGDVLIINQADIEESAERNENGQSIRMITTTERGLSRSRNMAIENARRDICLLCDDDEVLYYNYENTILEAFRTIPEADVIAFGIENKETRLKPKVQRIGYLNSLKIASYQIAFRRESILKNNIKFDVFMGAGSGNGCSEENKFLWDCLRKGLKVYYSPSVIATLHENESTWFFGYDETFFYQRGAATRYMMGVVLSTLYGIYYLFRKRKMYISSISVCNAGRSLFRGILENPIKKQVNKNKEGV